MQFTFSNEKMIRNKNILSNTERGPKEHFEKKLKTFQIKVKNVPLWFEKCVFKNKFHENLFEDNMCLTWTRTWTGLLRTLSSRLTRRVIDLIKTCTSLETTDSVGYTWTTMSTNRERTWKRRLREMKSV